MHTNTHMRSPLAPTREPRHTVVLKLAIPPPPLVLTDIRAILWANTLSDLLTTKREPAVSGTATNLLKISLAACGQTESRRGKCHRFHRGTQPQRCSLVSGKVGLFVSGSPSSLTHRLRFKDTLLGKLRSKTSHNPLLSSSFNP